MLVTRLLAPSRCLAGLANLKFLLYDVSCRHPDHEALQPAAGFQPKQYPKPDGQVSFDMAASLYRSGTNHEHDQPSHLRLLNKGVPTAVNLPIYAGPESRYCPAGITISPPHAAMEPAWSCCVERQAQRRHGLLRASLAGLLLQVCMSIQLTKPVHKSYRYTHRTVYIARLVV